MSPASALSPASPFVSLLEPFHVAIGQQSAHLSDGDFIELLQAFRLGQSLADEHGIEALQVGQDNELLQRGVVANVTFGVGVGVSPLFGGLAEQGDVEQIGFVGIDETCLCLGDRGWNQRLFDRIGVDAVVDLGQRPLEVPFQLEAVVFLVFEAAKLFDQINFELRADPHSEFKGNVRMGVGATIASGSCSETNRVGLFHPLLDANLVAVQSSLTFNYGEFAIIKTRIEDGFPDAEELDSVAVAKPIGYEKVSVLGPKHIREGNVIAILGGENRDVGSVHFDGGCFGFAHGRVQIGVAIRNLSNSKGLIPSYSMELELAKQPFS
jgi:hypothetical protein